MFRMFLLVMLAAAAAAVVSCDPPVRRNPRSLADRIGDYTVR